jgi:hypothetical protein
LEEGMDSPMNIVEKLYAIMSEVEKVDKDLTVSVSRDGKGYKAISHDEVTMALRSLFIKHRVLPMITEMSDVLDGNMCKVKLMLRFINVDNREDYVDVPGFGYGIDNQDKGPGKAISYAVKYVFLKTFCLTTRDDPERDDIDKSSIPTAQAADKPREDGPDASGLENEIQVRFSELVDYLGGWDKARAAAAAHSLELPAGDPKHFNIMMKKRLIVKLEGIIKANEK